MIRYDDSSCGILDKLNAISNCRNNFSLVQIARAITIELGGHDFLFILCRDGCRSDQTSEFQYLIGCDPRWPQIYLNKRWYLNDPDLQWGLKRSQTTVASRIQTVTEGQRTMRAHEQAHGFRSKLIAPVHAPKSQTVGVLYVGTPQQPSVGEPLLLTNRIQWRSLAAELLDWFQDAQRASVTRDLALTHKESVILDLLNHDYSASAIAEELNVAIPTVYSYYKKINKKFNVQHISFALKIALSMGILG
ncbi:LuxR family transcriptional regulator [Burkholderia gladioli]|uniref:LuxR family transcriptional regulator n=1 Tax=Burkholderia gladioli TaxID=28095 RepID=A0A2A7S9T3_BURGA|nr:autoinducer binding domain-containing protein [Burkholderia gladioli]PEH40417.1 LuxR family transcriptional regulator [Burkholderia gladioli]